MTQCEAGSLKAGGDDMIRSARPVEQPADLKRVRYERGVIGSAPLASMLSLCVLKRGPNLGEAPHPLRRRRLPVTRKAYADRSSCG
jgi:hypothetical protein